MRHSDEDCNLYAPQWLSIVGRGDRDREAAARHLFDCYYRRMAGYVAYVFHLDDFTAEEIAQVAMIKGLKGASRFKGHAKGSTWFMSIAIHEAKDHFRRQKSRPDQPDEFRSDPFAMISKEGDPSHDHDLPKPITQHLDPSLKTTDDYGREEEIQQCFDRHFARFYQDNPKCAELLRRFYLEGWSSKDLAAALGKTDAAMRKALESCREALRIYVAECTELRRG